MTKYENNQKIQGFFMLKGKISQYTKNSQRKCKYPFRS